MSSSHGGLLQFTESLMATDSMTVRDLRRLWKPHKERLNGSAAEHSTTIRFHRACSWLQRAEQATKDDLDLSLLSQWIAFNALYGQPLGCWPHQRLQRAGVQAGASYQSDSDLPRTGRAHGRLPDSR